MKTSVEQYLEARRAGHPHAGGKLNPRTLERVRRTLNMFERWIDSDLTTITERDAKIISDKINTYQDEGNRGWMRTIIRSFLEWATYEGLYTQPNYFWFADRTEDFMMNESIVEMPIRKIKSLMKLASTLPDDHQATTYQLLIGLVGLGGLRFHEVGEIKKSDIQDDGIIVSRDHRFVPLSPKLIHLLRQSANNSPSEWAITSWDKAADPSKPLADYFVSRQIGRFMEHSDPSNNQYVPFSLRKGFLKALEKVTRDESLYFSIAGHSHVNEQPLRPLFERRDLIETYKKVVSE